MAVNTKCNLIIGAIIIYCLGVVALAYGIDSSNRKLDKITELLETPIIITIKE